MLFDENKHRFFKRIVLSINHRKVEKQLFFKKAIKFTIKTFIFDVFDNTHTSITAQFRRLHILCSELFRRLLFSMTENDKNNDENNNQSFDLLKSVFHVRIAIRRKLNRIYMKNHNFSI